jgi:GNAT superfamily N-acetyltransferase
MIRRVTESDLGAVVGLVHELAEYERAADDCHLSIEQLRVAVFGPSPALFGHVAVVDQAVVGCALWFRNFSTWRGVHGIYLEDLYVQPGHRGGGLGPSGSTAPRSEPWPRTADPPESPELVIEVGPGPALSAAGGDSPTQ